MTSGILRSESLYRAELSDFMGVTLNDNKSDIRPMLVMVNQIAIGKNNHDRTLYGRATRHKDVRLCCVGALSFYLQYRIFLTGELQSFSPEDWLDNRNWVDIKLLADTLHSKNHIEAMQNGSFSKTLKEVLLKLELPTDKLLHLGRNVGPKIFDLLEAEVEDIRRMGNWNPSIYDSCYSTKLPIGAIRMLAVFSGRESKYFNARSRVEPPAHLLKLTPVGNWVYDALEAARQSHFAFQFV
jgi:hypothetical protein